MTNREIAQEISNRIGTAPVPFDSVYSIALQIYHELGGEESQFDSVYSILLEILPLVEGGINPIEEVNELPEASENKEKFYRLSSDDNVYVSELKSRTTINTNRLPDEQQIDKAYLYDTDNDFVSYYRGIWKIICTDGEISLYCWGDDFENDMAYFTYDNAVNINDNSKTIWYGDTMYESVDENAKTIIDNETLEDLKSYFSVHDFLNPIPATYNAPESAQIGNASFTDGTLGLDAIYSGEEVEHNNEVWYKWTTGTEGRYYISNKKASEIYGKFESYWLSDTKLLGFNGNDYVNLTVKNIMSIYIPQLNAPDSEQVGNAYISYTGDKYLYKGQYTLLNEDNSIYASNVAGFFETGFMMFAKDWLPNEVYYQNIDEDDAIKSDNVDEIELLPNNTIKVINGNIWRTNKVYDIFGDRGIELHPVKYQRTETTEIWGWEKVATEDVVNNLSVELSTKANKVDYVVQLNPTTQQYDWVSLNSVTETGVYRISIEVNMMGTVMKMGTCELFVSNTAPTIIQSILIPGDDSISLHVRKSTNSGSSWTDSDIAIPSINDGATTSTTETYSVTKINSLISALETRIAALEGK